MISTSINKFKKTLRSKIGSYPYRKLTMVFIIFLSFFMIYCVISLVYEFNSFSSQEQKIKNHFFEDPKFVVEEQRNFFNVLISLTVIGIVSSIFTLLIGLFLLLKGNNNGYLFLRITTWVFIITILSIILIIAIKPKDISIRDPKVTKKQIRENPEEGLQKILSPKYWEGWFILFGSLFSSITCGLARKEYGFLKKDSSIKRYEDYKKTI